jgi:hypothetical protein
MATKCRFQRRVMSLRWKKIDLICFLVFETNEINQDSGASTPRPEAPSRLHWLSKGTRADTQHERLVHQQYASRKKNNYREGCTQLEKLLGLEPCWLDNYSEGEDGCAQRQQIIQLLNQGVGMSPSRQRTPGRAVTEYRLSRRKFQELSIAQ